MHIGDKIAKILCDTPVAGIPRKRNTIAIAGFCDELKAQHAAGWSLIRFDFSSLRKFTPAPTSGSSAGRSKDPQDGAKSRGPTTPSFARIGRSVIALCGD